MATTSLANTPFGLRGKVALVTGGSKGLGKAMARALAEAGADIIISSRNEDEVREALKDILEGLNPQPQGRYFAVDQGDRLENALFAQMASEAFGENRGVDILVNNAGSNCPQELEDIRDEDWDRILELNLTSCMSLTRALVGGMKERGWGRIIYISSIMALSSSRGRSVYSASKAALMGMARAQAIELAEHHITVNCINPGYFMTDLPKRMLSEEQRKRTAEKVPLKRWGNPAELAGPVLLLASDAGSYITGEALVVDGGILLVI